MKYHPLPVSNTYRHFVALARKVQRLLERGQFKQLPTQQQQQLVGKLKQLYIRLSGVFSKGRLRRILATAAFILGLGAGAVRAQEFAVPQKNPFGLAPAEFPLYTFTDLDKDNDQDIMSIEYNFSSGGHDFIFYENSGTAQAPAFGAPQTNPFGLANSEENLSTPYLVDIDNDGDQDLFTGTYDSGRFLYYENQGTAENPSFAPALENPFNLQPSSYYMQPVFVDLDNDGDFDLLGTELFGFHYQENTGSVDAPQFSSPVNAPFGWSNEEFSFIFHTVGDLDMDGDYDVLVGGYPLNTDDPTFLEYLENTGSPESPVFASPVVNPFGIAFPDIADFLTIPALVDIDDDGDLDLFVSGYTYDDVSGEEDIVFWYFENTAVINSAKEPEQAANLKVFPTVAEGFLNWQLGLAETLLPLQLEAFSSDGRRVKQWRADGLQGQLDISNLLTGLYQLRLSDGSGRLLARERFVVR